MTVATATATLSHHSEGRCSFNSRSAYSVYNVELSANANPARTPYGRLGESDFESGKMHLAGSLRSHQCSLFHHERTLARISQVQTSPLRLTSNIAKRRGCRSCRRDIAGSVSLPPSAMLPPVHLDVGFSPSRRAEAKSLFKCRVLLVSTGPQALYVNRHQIESKTCFTRVVAGGTTESCVLCHWSTVATLAWQCSSP